MNSETKKTMVVFMKKQGVIIALFVVALILATGCGQTPVAPVVQSPYGAVNCGGLVGGGTAIATLNSTVYPQGTFNMTVGFVPGFGNQGVGSVAISQQGYGYGQQGYSQTVCLNSLNTGSQFYYDGNYIQGYLLGTIQSNGMNGGCNGYCGGYGMPGGYGGQQQVQAYIQGQIYQNARVQGMLYVGGTTLQLSIQ